MTLLRPQLYVLLSPPASRRPSLQTDGSLVATAAYSSITNTNWFCLRSGANEESSAVPPLAPQVVLAPTPSSFSLSLAPHNISCCTLPFTTRCAGGGLLHEQTPPSPRAAVKKRRAAEGSQPRVRHFKQRQARARILVREEGDRQRAVTRVIRTSLYGCDTGTPHRPSRSIRSGPAMPPGPVAVLMKTASTSIMFCFTIGSRPLTQ